MTFPWLFMVWGYKGSRWFFTKPFEKKRRKSPNRTIFSKDRSENTNQKRKTTRKLTPNIRPKKFVGVVKLYIYITLMLTAPFCKWVWSAFWVPINTFSEGALGLVTYSSLLTKPYAGSSLRHPVIASAVSCFCFLVTFVSIAKSYLFSKSCILLMDKKSCTYGQYPTIYPT